jgi:rare lipoprotein A
MAQLLLFYGQERDWWMMRRHTTTMLLATLLAASALHLKADQVGVASWYGPRFHGRRAASGEIFNQHRFTAAHRHLPFGTQVKVTNLDNGKSVIVRINDRGPYVKGRIIDLSRAAARELEMTKDGTVRISLEVLSTL